MYEKYFDMEHMPFSCNLPVDRLYTSKAIEDAIGRLKYSIDRQGFSVVMADPGCGKSTLVRMLISRLPKDRYQPLYLSDSKLTPKWLYVGLIDQMGLEPKFYRGDSKCILQKQLEQIKNSQERNIVVILDEAHLLGKETLEEFRFLLNCQCDSTSPLALVLMGQKELWSQKLRLHSYAAIRQRIDMHVILERLGRSEIPHYIAAHLTYAGCKDSLFTSDADDEIYKISTGIPRMINSICSKSLLYACQQQKRSIDGHMVRYVADHEMLGAEEFGV